MLRVPSRRGRTGVGNATHLLYIEFAKIVKGESRNKRETKFHDWIMPSRILSYSKIVKGESRNKWETKFRDWIMPNRILSSRIVQRYE